MLIEGLCHDVGANLFDMVGKMSSEEVIALKHKNMRTRTTHSYKYKEKAVVINA